MSRVNRYEYEDWKGFGSRVKIYREKIGMTKEKFAENINRSENYVNELEKGNTSCSVHTLHQISKTLKIPCDIILYGEIDMKKNYTNKDILLEMIERCDEDELEILKDLASAIFPNLEKIIRKNKANNKNNNK